MVPIVPLYSSDFTRKTINALYFIHYLYVCPCFLFPRFVWGSRNNQCEKHATCNQLYICVFLLYAWKILKNWIKLFRRKKEKKTIQYFAIWLSLLLSNLKYYIYVFNDTWLQFLAINIIYLIYMIPGSSLCPRICRDIWKTFGSCPPSFQHLLWKNK